MLLLVSRTFKSNISIMFAKWNLSVTKRKKKEGSVSKMFLELVVVMEPIEPLTAPFPY